MRNNRNINSRTIQPLTNKLDPGPYLAKVVSHLDNKFMGSLRVQLLKTMESNAPEYKDDTLITAHYASPFYGVTSWRANGNNDNYQSTQQSYGMWFVPPDVDTKVLVIFVEGRKDICYWFACVPDDYMNFMIPDGRASTVLTTAGSRPGGSEGKKLPVGEYNKRILNPEGNSQPTSYVKPVNTDFVERLTEQGLLEDDFRGLTSSSARREVPSAVFGINTPGPLDKRSGAPVSPRGPQTSQANVFSSRLGGHSIVMDDGDANILRRGRPGETPPEYVDLENSSEPITDEMRTLPANELFRIRTRTGHQILMHNTEDLIYISNSRGTAWIELTSNGKIDIYAQDSVSIHTEGEFNLTADKNINLTSGGNINLNATESIKQSSGRSIDLIAAGGYISANASDTLSLQSGEFMSASAGSSLNFISAGGSTNLVSSSSINIKSGAETAIQSNGLYAQSSSNINLNATGTLNSVSTSGNILVTGDLKISATGAFDLLAGPSLRIGASKIDVTSAGILKHQATEIHELSSGAIFRTADTINDLSSSSHTLGSTVVYVDSLLNVKEDIVTPKKIKADSAGPAPYNGSAPAPATGADPATSAETFGSVTDFQISEPVLPSPAEIATRVPQHEPWLQHENLDPEAFKLGSSSYSSDRYVSATPDPFYLFLASQPQSRVSAENSRSGQQFTGSSSDDEIEENEGQGNYTNGSLEAIEFFKSKGYTDAQACGIVGALQQETDSTINPAGWNPDAGGVGARGIAQWRGPKDRLLNAETFLGKPILVQPEMNISAPGYQTMTSQRLPTEPITANSTRAEQLNIIWWELQGGDAIASNRRDELLIDTGNGTNDARAVAVKFDDIFLRSKGAGIELRKNYAEALYRNYITAGLPVQPGAPDAILDEFPQGSLAAPSINSFGGVPNVISLDTAGKIRSFPVKEIFYTMLNRAARDAEISNVILYSAANRRIWRKIPLGFTDYSQWFTFPTVGPQEGNGRTGSDRHDTGLAGDIRLYKNGKLVSSNTKEGKQAMNRFCTAAVRYGARGFGHSPFYMNNSRKFCNIHIDMLGAARSNGWNQNIIGYWNGTEPWFYTPLQNELSRILGASTAV